MVVLITAVTIFCIRNYTKEDNFSHPEWEPDNSILQIVWPFIMCLYTWCWYNSLSQHQRWIDLLFGANLCFIALWSISFYLEKWITLATISIAGILAISVFQTFLLFQKSTDNGILSMVISSWLIVSLIITVNTRAVLPSLGKPQPGAPQHPQREVSAINPEDLD